MSPKHSSENLFVQRQVTIEEVTDQLFLSIWLERHSRASRVQQFEKLLRLFPFSQREQPQSVLSIQAIGSTEPPLLERPMNGPVVISDLISALREFQADDLAYRIESWWDLWQFDEDWDLRPARVALSCFGPDFDNGTERQVTEQEDLRIDFGVDSNYLPRPDVPGSARLIESNIKSLLHLVHEVELLLPVAKRRLETESGENFSERLEQAFSDGPSIQ